MSAAPGVNVFVFADTVRPRGAGTVVLAGSHQLVARYSARHSGTLHARELKHTLVADHPWFRDLYDADDRTNRIARFMVEGTEIDGVGLRVVELTGAPGDGILMDARTLHTVAPNCVDTPRMMLNQLVTR